MLYLIIVLYSRFFTQHFPIFVKMFPTLKQYLFCNVKVIIYLQGTIYKVSFTIFTFNGTDTSNFIFTKVKKRQTNVETILYRWSRCRSSDFRQTNRSANGENGSRFARSATCPGCKSDACCSSNWFKGNSTLQYAGDVSISVNLKLFYW